MTTSAGKPSINAAACGASPFCKREPHRTSQAANDHMDLRAQAAARAAERLIIRPLFFAPAACRRARMMVESTIRYSKSGSSDIASKIRHQTPLMRPSAEASEHAVPIAKRLRKIAPGRAGAHDPQHTFHEHPIVASGRTFLVRPTNDQRSHPLPRRIAQNQPLHHTQDFSQKQP